MIEHQRNSYLNITALECAVRKTAYNRNMRNPKVIYIHYRGIFRDVW
jgi:hypothetical protein